MTQEDKDLLLKDLYGRLSSEIQCKIDLRGILDFFDEYREKFEAAQNISSNLFDTVSDRNYTLYGFPCPDRVTLLEFDGLEDYGIPVEFIKPYLRPMSSMTEEERRKFSIFIGKTEVYVQQVCLDADSMANPIIGGGKCVYWGLFDRCIDWLNEHHFDYRRLIEKGLALEAPEGMYKTE